MIPGAAEYYRKTYGEGSPQHIASMPSKTSRAHIDRPKIEPRIAEVLFNQMVAREKSLTVLLGHMVTKAERDGALLKTVTLQPMHGDDTITVCGKVFADGMYEGDLMAAAGVKTQIGREARSQYNEPHAGASGLRSADLEAGRGVMTAFVRRIKTMMDDIGRERGKSLKRCIRIPETLAKCKAAGLDIPEWDKQRLVELINIFSFYTHTIKLGVEKFLCHKL